MEITDVKVIPVDDEKLKAFVSIVFDQCFVVTDIKIIHGPKGLFVSMPSKKRKDGTFKDIAHPLNNQMRQYLEEKVLTVYRQQVASAPAAPGQPPQTVVVQQQPAQVITIEPTNPQVVYVPSYNPTVVYGAWPYPAYPPAYPYPPGYAFGAAALSFGVGMAVGAAVWALAVAAGPSIATLTRAAMAVRR